VAGEPARRLVLLRHAKSAWPDDVADHERPLAPRGRRDAPAVGRWLRSTGQVPDHVLCSTARRARQTWELAQQELGARPAVTFDDRVYGAATAGLLNLARLADPETLTLLIVGHEPAMRELTLELAGPPPARTGHDDDLVRVRAKFPTAAIAVLSFAGRWAELGPGQARLIGFVQVGAVRSVLDDKD
jgi:phosphohistidine phosphatase